MKTEIGRTWKNWAATSESKPAKILYPSTIEEVSDLVKQAKINRKKIRVVGAGHSFTSLAHTNEWLLSLDSLTGIESLDEENQTVTVFAGTRLYQLGEQLGKRGLAQENLGDINVQSIAGAISTGTHGTGLQFGNISTQVLQVTLVKASGEILNLSEKENPELFKASLVSFGTIGIIVKVSLKIIKSPVYLYKSEKMNFYELEKNLDHLIQSNRHFEFFLFPYSDTVQIKTMNMTEGQPQSLTWHRFNTLLIENYLFFLISEICRIFPKTSTFFSKLSAKAVGKTTIQAESHQLFATPRKVRFCEMEYSIPLEHLIPALHDIRQLIEEKQYNVHFPIECRTVKEDDIWLSPSYKRDSAYIAFHMYKGMPHEEYFHDMEEMMKKYNGRPHWGKMHSKKMDELIQLYPKLNDFLAIRHKLDSDGIFINDYLSKLFQEDLLQKQSIGLSQINGL